MKRINEDVAKKILEDIGRQYGSLNWKEFFAHVRECAQARGFTFSRRTFYRIMNELLESGVFVKLRYSHKNVKYVFSSQTVFEQEMHSIVERLEKLVRDRDVLDAYELAEIKRAKKLKDKVPKYFALSPIESARRKRSFYEREGRRIVHGHLLLHKVIKLSHVLLFAMNPRLLKLTGKSADWFAENYYVGITKKGVEMVPRAAFKRR